MASALEPQAAVADVGSTQAVDAGWILSKLAQPAPTRTAFVEVRGSALLKNPLRLSGEYRRPDADTLVREVRAPYQETTTLAKGQATIARSGKPARTFSLARVPELAGLQSGFGSLLSGDQELLRQQFNLDARGTRQAWQMTMQPRDATLRKSVRDIVLHGRGSELRCIETTPVQGDVQRTLLASAARAVTPAMTATALGALCRDSSR